MIKVPVVLAGAIDMGLHAHCFGCSPKENCILPAEFVTPDGYNAASCLSSDSICKCDAWTLSCRRMSGLYHPTPSSVLPYQALAGPSFY